ncbi:hypothetical protein [Aerolutibacter ruishenii]|nr:hypothetical protein [Lysobacter ruishenii]
MDMTWVILGGAAILLVAVLAVVRKRRGGQVAFPAIELPTLPVVVQPVEVEALAVPEEPEVPTRLVLAVDDEPVFAMTMLDEAEGSKQIAGLSRHAPSAFGRALEPLMQVAPSMATAGMAGSRQLMEVVINGPLVAAADGNGLRAMTMGANGVQQNARLFEPKALQNVANAAAIWQLASVAVAQKHLADISATLKRVEDKIAGIQSMLEEERAALIDGALKYIHSARQAMQQGEFLDRTRDKLEDFEIQLEQAGTTLLRQIERESKSELERDTVGCEGEYQSALAKHQALAARAAELVACAEVRLANWYLCSLYPDRSKMLESRMQQIQQFMAQVARVQKQLSGALDADCEKIDARFTSDETIAERRTHVRNEAKSGKEALSKGAKRCATIIERVQAVADDRSSTSRLLIETNGKTPTAVYLAHEKPTLPPIRIQNEELVACL